MDRSIFPLGSAAWLGCFALLIAALPVRAGTLTLATYNIENYTAADRMTDAGYRKDYPKPEHEKAALRQVIRALDADLLVLQEVGPRPYLDELQRDLKLAGVDYPQAALIEGDDGDRHVAVLSRRPFTAIVPHADLVFTYFGRKEPVKRGVIEVRVTTSAGELAIFGLHLKSRYTDRPDDPGSMLRRTGEASAIRDRILQRFPDPAAARYLILGDFNDAKDSRAVQRLLTRGATVISQLLPAADSRGESWTHFYQREDAYTRVDHILVSPGLRGFVVGAARIYDGAGVLEASDHRPVLVTLELPDSPAVPATK